MALTKRYLRTAVASRAGDFILLTATGNGATDGSTIVLSSLNTRETDADLGKWAVVEYSSTDVRFGLITASSGTPYTLTITPPLGVQVTTGLVVEIMAYRPDFYTGAINDACQNIFPWLYAPLYDSSITIDDPGVYNYNLPAGVLQEEITQVFQTGLPNTPWVGMPYFEIPDFQFFPTGIYTIDTASAAASPTFTTTRPHGFVVGDAVTVAGNNNSTLNGAWTVATVPSTTSFTIGAHGNAAGGTGGTVVLTAGPSQQIWLNALGAPFFTGLSTGASLVLLGWQHLTGVTPDGDSAAHPMYRIQDDTVAGPELGEGGESDTLLREWILMYLLRTLMAAPATPDRAAFAEAFNAQQLYALQQSQTHQMRRPPRRKSL